jgi:hypothetical protein
MSTRKVEMCGASGLSKATFCVLKRCKLLFLFEDRLLESN